MLHAIAVSSTPEMPEMVSGHKKVVMAKTVIPCRGARG
jgi:hypothetical protein